MGEMGDDYRAMRERTRALRDKYGVSCPRCAEVRPRAPASILLPKQRCRVDGLCLSLPKTDGRKEECPLSIQLFTEIGGSLGVFGVEHTWRPNFSFAPEKQSNPYGKS